MLFFAEVSFKVTCSNRQFPRSPGSPLLLPNPNKKRSMAGRRNSLTAVELELAAKGEDPSNAGRVKVKHIQNENLTEFAAFPPSCFINSCEQFVRVMCPEQFRPPSAPSAQPIGGEGRTGGLATSDSHPILGRGDGINCDSESFRKALTKRLRCAVRGNWKDMQKIRVPGFAQVSAKPEKNSSDECPGDDALNSARSSNSTSSIDCAFGNTHRTFHSF